MLQEHFSDYYSYKDRYKQPTLNQPLLKILSNCWRAGIYEHTGKSCIVLLSARATGNGSNKLKLAKSAFAAALTLQFLNDFKTLNEAINKQ